MSLILFIDGVDIQDRDADDVKGFDRISIEQSDRDIRDDHRL